MVELGIEPRTLPLSSIPSPFYFPVPPCLAGFASSWPFTYMESCYMWSSVLTAFTQCVLKVHPCCYMDCILFLFLNGWVLSVTIYWMVTLAQHYLHISALLTALPILSSFYSWRNITVTCSDSYMAKPNLTWFSSTQHHLWGMLTKSGPPGWHKTHCSLLEQLTQK